MKRQKEAPLLVVNSPSERQINEVKRILRDRNLSSATKTAALRAIQPGPISITGCTLLREVKEKKRAPLWKRIIT